MKRTLTKRVDQSSVLLVHVNPNLKDGSGHPAIVVQLIRDGKYLLLQDTYGDVWDPDPSVEQPIIETMWDLTAKVREGTL